MPVDDALLYKVTKYGKLIKKKEKIAHALSRLNDVDMTLEILSATNIGRYVNRLCNDPEYGCQASRIIEKWKEVARRSGVRGGDDDEGSEGEGPCENDTSSRRASPDGAQDAEDADAEEYVQRHDLPRKEPSRKQDVDGYRRDRSSKHDNRKRRHRDIDEETVVKRPCNDVLQDDETNRQLDISDRRKSSGGSSRSNNVDRRDRQCEEQEPSKRRKDSEEGSSKKSHHDERKHRKADVDESGHLIKKKKNSERSSRSTSQHDSRGKHHRMREYEDESEGDNCSFSKANDDNNYEAEDDREGTPSNQSDASSYGERLSRSGSPREDTRDLKSNAPGKNSSASKREKNSAESKKTVTDFDMMLLSAETSKTKSRKSREPHWKFAEVPLLSNYQPFPQAFRAMPQLSSKETPPAPADDFNPENMFKPRNDRGKVFAGRRKVFATNMPTLFSLCLRVLTANVKVLYYAEYLNYDVIKSVLEKCSAEDLERIESKHQYLEEDSGELWQRIVNKKYPGEEPENGDSWKDLYYYLEKERERKLKLLSQRIGKQHQTDSTNGPRKAILADATAPRNVRRRQMQYGTAVISKPLPSAKEVSSARRQIFESGGCKDALAALPQAVINKNSTVGAKLDRSASKKAPPKKGALMIKTMKMLNMKRK